MIVKPCIEFTAPYRIYLPEEFFDVALGGRISLVKPVALLPPIYPEGGIQLQGKDVEFSHDIFGLAGRTRFIVIVDERIDGDSDWKSRITDNVDSFVDIALKLANRMLEVYRDQDVNRLVGKSFHIVQLVKTDILDVRITGLGESLNEIEGFVISNPFSKPIMFGPEGRTPEIIAGIRQTLKNGTPVPIYRDLMSSAHNYLWRGQYRLVPVEANTSFESYIAEAIRLLNPQIAISERDNLFNKLLKLEELLSISTRKSELDKVVWFTKPQNGWKSLIQADLRNWYDNCYQVRNKVIHEGYNQVTQQEALSAFQAAISAIKHVRSETSKVIPNN